MKRFKATDIIIGVIVLVLVGVLVYRLAKPKTKPLVIDDSPTVQQKVEERFGFDIPDNVEKAQLKDVSGGDGGGIATREEILADLPDPKQGEFYQAWFEKDSKFISIGKLRLAKGGWMVNYDSARFAGYDKIVISLEKTLDGTLETKILEGSFE